MSIKSTSRVLTILVMLALVLSLFTTTGQAAPTYAPTVLVTFTILHTNDFHGQLEGYPAAQTPARPALPVCQYVARFGACQRAAGRCRR